MSSHGLIEVFGTNFLQNRCIVEIGSAREMGNHESSTIFFHSLSKAFNAQFFSVDFSPSSYKFAADIIGANAFLLDGCEFLENFSSNTNLKISLLYLDNFDVIYNEQHKKSLLSRVGSIYEDRNEDINNERSAQVHFEQLMSALPHLADQNVVIIDDTKLTESGWWGKGALVVPKLIELGYSIKAKSDDGVLLSNF